MRREIIVAAVLAALCAAGPASARGLAPVHRLDGVQLAQASDAVSAVLQLYPGARILAVRRAPNGDFVVTIRLGNQVRRVRVDGQTGQVK